MSVCLPFATTIEKAIEESKFSTVLESDNFSSYQSFAAADSKTFAATSPPSFKATFIAAIYSTIQTTIQSA
jgi:hypothetical protein